MLRRIFLIALFPALTAIGLILAGGGFLDSGRMPPCLIHEWTGLHCPGCGGTRAFQALARLDLMGALRMNSLGTLFVLGVALLVFRTSWEAAFPQWRWRRLPFDERWLWGALMMMVCFTVLRNVPSWPFCLLAPH
ncbi:DUF2752 domain-containing protein [Haloferula chungangensis]|uniref:DUF2752 domain-containing protein n=1 Tax=Haloferula chungangensis TaxID=1048331 RepID=A0ABW2L3L4_9BACT